MKLTEAAALRSVRPQTLRVSRTPSHVPRAVGTDEAAAKAHLPRHSPDSPSPSQTPSSAPCVVISAFSIGMVGSNDDVAPGIGIAAHGEVDPYRGVDEGSWVQGLGVRRRGGADEECRKEGRSDGVRSARAGNYGAGREAGRVARALVSPASVVSREVQGAGIGVLWNNRRPEEREAAHPARGEVFMSRTTARPVRRSQPQGPPEQSRRRYRATLQDQERPAP